MKCKYHLFIHLKVILLEHLLEILASYPKNNRLLCAQDTYVQYGATKHRIRELFEMEGTFEGNQVQLP